MISIRQSPASRNISHTFNNFSFISLSFLTYYTNILITFIITHINQSSLMRSNRQTSSRMNHTILLSSFSISTFIEISIMNNSNGISIWSFILIKVTSIRKTITIILNHLFTKRCNKSVFFSISSDSHFKVTNKSFTTHKSYILIAILSITVKNITDCTFKFVNSQNFTISIVVRFTTNF
ncbi:MAG: hypothetical protein DBX97_23240 [Collinsella tanakaei]|nr:MAG: hypothetical protein DBX97_23240 [Collinsella tanakaei]